MSCPDYSDFQEALKNMRKADDLIVSTMNTVIPTHSFDSNETSACKDFYVNLEDGYKKRDHFIRNCIFVTSENVKRLKVDREANADDIQLGKTLKQEQAKLRMLQVELTVEDLIKQRTFSVFNDKCRKFLNS